MSNDKSQSLRVSVILRLNDVTRAKEHGGDERRPINSQPTSSPDGANAMSIFNQINQQLPLKISHASWTGEVLTISGTDWGLNTPGAWRIRTPNRVLAACFDDNASDDVGKLVGRLVVRVEAQSADFAVDPRLVLDNGEFLEIFSSDTFEPWTWRLPSPPVWVAAPADEAWVQRIKEGL
ncbi:hypothetical protein G6O69_00960 [Pseudenhygromyxa sp. WMMC2535]|uniref:hypothetical protein n=1 Tax=Pseudenhygromyxa sp. WMMC2535 TaxID=2712867 RepID=UPI0015530058|nr:hypothetical protein [Pseudenhygromyxa sp. WMMC2535]NVB36380.1 hypothetical protein [Pseudenhygromyxa sp. WMMC2535]